MQRRLAWKLKQKLSSFSLCHTHTHTHTQPQTEQLLFKDQSSTRSFVEKEEETSERLMGGVDEEKDGGRWRREVPGDGKMREKQGADEGDDVIF